MNWSRTGAPASCDMTAAAWPPSYRAGALPNEPAPSQYWTRTLFTGRLSSAGERVRIVYASCVFASTSAPSLVTCAIAAVGPIGMWPLYWCL